MHSLVLEGRVSSDDLFKFGLGQFTVDVVGGMRRSVKLPSVKFLVGRDFTLMTRLLRGGFSSPPRFL